MNIHDATEQAYKNGYADGKKEVAREIFEEIEKAVYSKIPLKINSTISGKVIEPIGFGKEMAYWDVLRCLVELEKKYTEGK